MKTVIEIDVINDATPGQYDVWMSNDGSSGIHYRNVTASEIGDFTADYVDTLEEADSGKSFLKADEATPQKYMISNRGELCECVGQIVDIFEDFLDKKGVVLENDEKTDEDTDPETTANIYGTDYGYLQDRLEKLLYNWNAFNKEVVEC